MVLFLLLGLESDGVTTGGGGHARPGGNRKDSVVSGRRQVPRFQGCQGNNRSAVQMFFWLVQSPLRLARGAGRVVAFCRQGSRGGQSRQSGTMSSELGWAELVGQQSRCVVYCVLLQPKALQRACWARLGVEHEFLAYSSVDDRMGQNSNNALILASEMTSLWAAQ